MMAQITAVITAPMKIGILNSIFSAIAAPKSSARAVAIAASIAVLRCIIAIHGLKNFLVASAKHSPVTIPR